MSILKINGVEKDFADCTPGTLRELLDQMKIQSATVVAEIDGTIIPRDKFSETKIKAGQAIELIKFMGGG